MAFQVVLGQDHDKFQAHCSEVIKDGGVPVGGVCVVADQFESDGTEGKAFVIKSAATRYTYAQAFTVPDPVVPPVVPK